MLLLRGEPIESAALEISVSHALIHATERRLSAVAKTPLGTDQIIEDEGSQVFLDEEVAPLLDGRTLDARITDDQQVAFTLLP